MLQTPLDIDTFKYIFKDLQICKILTFSISFTNPRYIKAYIPCYDYLKEFIKDFDDYNYKKFTINLPCPMVI